MRIANGSRSSCSIQRDFITCRDSSGRAIQSDFLPGIAAQCHAVIQGNLVVHRSVCIGSLSDCRIFAVSADGDRLGGDFLHIADIGGIGVRSIYRVIGIIHAGCTTLDLSDLLAATADAAGGDAGAIYDGQARAAQGGRSGGHIAIASVKGDGIVTCANGHLIRRELGVHLHGDDAVVVDLRGQVVRLVGMTVLGIIGADCHRIAEILFDRLIGTIHLVAGREVHALACQSFELFHDNDIVVVDAIRNVDKAVVIRVLEGIRTDDMIPLICRIIRISCNMAKRNRIRRFRYSLIT